MSSNIGSRTGQAALTAEIAAAAVRGNIDARVRDSLTILDAVITERSRQQGGLASLRTNPAIEIDADDLFDLVSILMGLSDPIARQIGLKGVVSAVQADDFAQFQIGCRAVQRFCGWAELPSTAAH